MFGLTIWHWVLFAAVAILVLGSGRVSGFLTDLGKGVGAFRKGMSEADDSPPKKDG